MYMKWVWLSFYKTLFTRIVGSIWTIGNSLQTSTLAKYGLKYGLL